MVTSSVDATAASSTSAAAVSTSVAAASTFKLGFLPYSYVRTAEVTLVINVISTKVSFRAQEGIRKIFKKVFTDSHIVLEMQLSWTKTAYIACFELTSYFHHKLILNRISKLLQMDLAVRFWGENKNEVSSRFWNSSFMGHSSASDLLRGFKEGLGDEVEQGKVVQESIHRPNVNWAFLELLRKDVMTCEEDSVIIDTGSCRLHVVHGMFQGAFRTQAGKLTTIKILPRLKTYFKTKSAQLPDTYSVKSAEILEDCLLLPKLHFLTIASSFESFLRDFKAPKRMFPFLHFACSYKLINIYVENVDNCVKLRQVKIEPAARLSLDEARVKEVYMEKYRLRQKLSSEDWDAIVVDQEMLRYARGASAKQKEAFAKQKRRETELEKLSLYKREEKG
ncbi:hypothetical protein PR048_015319 [Dryococelus australis]|uniref:Uncharacterized protein n=1 Tax=Dryococelus australis TaxID=614101 RepID=A0ABQ9HGS9_9NEOP|nr:hypothetical protein PR048_015319 [Dryococelus australis]